MVVAFGYESPIATQEVIEELIKLAKEMSAKTKRGVDLALKRLYRFIPAPLTIS